MAKNNVKMLRFANFGVRQTGLRFASSKNKEFTVSKPAPGIVMWTMNRPEAKNAISKSMVASFEKAIDSIKNDKVVRALIINSAVPGTFCAGADLKERAQMTEEEVGPFVSRLQKISFKKNRGSNRFFY